MSFRPTRNEAARERERETDSDCLTFPKGPCGNWLTLYLVYQVPKFASVLRSVDVPDLQLCTYGDTRVYVPTYTHKQGEFFDKAQLDSPETFPS